MITFNLSVTFNNMTLLNETTARPVPSILTSIVAWFTVFSCAATLILNGLILYVYFTQPSMRTPFNVYIANLCMTEFLLASTAIPGNFIRSYYGYWPFSEAACTFVAYSNQSFGSAVRYGHLLISCNRLWAVTFPIGYKERHNKRVATTIVVGTWVYLHVLILPVLIPGRMWPALNGDCYINTSFQYIRSLIVANLGFVVPEVIIVLTYPFIAFKVHRHRQERNRTRTQVLKMNATVILQIGTKPAVNETEIVCYSDDSNNSKKWSSHDRLLFLLVIAVLICWTPNNVFYLLVQTHSYWNLTYFSIQYLLLYTNSWLNPILFYIALDKCYKAVNHLFAIT